MNSILHTSSVEWVGFPNVFNVPLSEPFLLEDIGWMDVLGSSIGGSGMDVGSGLQYGSCSGCTKLFYQRFWDGCWEWALIWMQKIILSEVLGWM